MGINSGEKKIDLPPRGSRNADPITGAPGASHRSRDRSGGRRGRRRSGRQLGRRACRRRCRRGPGRRGGGLRRQGTRRDDRSDHRGQLAARSLRVAPYVEAGETFATYMPAYRYGAEAEAKYGDAGIDLMDERLRRDWEASKDSDLPWSKAKAAVEDAYARTVEIRRARECPGTCDEVQED